MEEFGRCENIGKAAMKAGMDRHTGARYVRLGKLPSELVQERTWRTRRDPFTAEDWASVVERLKDAPELDAKILFEELLATSQGRYHEGQLRSFQRRVRAWRAQEGPPKEVFFPQQHRPGEALQTDWTSGSKLGITVEGKLLDHLLCHVVLPFSNWEWATVCRSESMASLKRGLQAAVFHLGRVPEFHQTDNSSAATHDLRTGKRGFNDEYLAIVEHLGMKARTTKVGAKEQNGDVEAANGALKRRMAQHLILRGSREFESMSAYEAFVQQVVEKANQGRQKRLQEELHRMRPLQVNRLPDYPLALVRIRPPALVKSRPPHGRRFGTQPGNRNRTLLPVLSSHRRLRPGGPGVSRRRGGEAPWSGRSPHGRSPWRRSG
ncbi:MAG: IS21 family transposase [Acidobacteriota bacterium]